jgi:hypothetical protein
MRHLSLVPLVYRHIPFTSVAQAFSVPLGQG